MKACFSLPSCDYTLYLTQEELNELFISGCVTSRISRTSCMVNRVAICSNETKLEVIDSKNMDNLLMFDMDSSVADVEPHICNVQFINIALENKKE